MLPRPDDPAARARFIQAAIIQSDIARKAYLEALLAREPQRRAILLREGERASRLASCAALDASFVMGGGA